MADTFLADCTCADLRGYSGWASLRDPTMDTQTRNAINIVLLNSIIAGLNSTDTLSLSELLDLGKCCECGNLEQLEQEALMTLMLWLLALNVGTVSSTAGELINEACSLKCDPRTIEVITLTLWCKFFQAVNTINESRQ